MDSAFLSDSSLLVSVGRASSWVTPVSEGRKRLYNDFLPLFLFSSLFAHALYDNSFASTRRVIHFTRILFISTTKQGGMASEMVGDGQCFLLRKLLYLQQERRNVSERAGKRGSEK